MVGMCMTVMSIDYEIDRQDIGGDKSHPTSKSMP